MQESKRATISIDSSNLISDTVNFNINSIVIKKAIFHFEYVVALTLLIQSSTSKKVQFKRKRLLREHYLLLLRYQK